MTVAPELSTVVVAWRSRADLAALAAAFPVDPRHELVVVDNAGDLTAADLGDAANVRLLSPGRNLGFAAGSNRGAAAATAPRLLFLNPDALPVGAAFDELLAGFVAFPEAAGLVPRLIGADGSPQCAWQLRPLPAVAGLLAHAFFWNPARGPRREPPAGAPVAQPAAAALALRRAAFDAAGGFDERFWPAWFEDVDLARRLAAGGARLRYLPAATFRHRLGGSLAELGYGAFLRAYNRNLALYLRLHHGAAWAALYRALVPLGAALRLLALPLRAPRRAGGRRAAARALVGAARDAWQGFPREASG